MERYLLLLTFDDSIPNGYAASKRKKRAIENNCVESP